MISRHWRGLAKAEHAPAYVEHLRHDTFPQLAAMDGFVGASILQRADPRGVEFLVITRWQSAQAIRQFAGEDLEAAVVPALVQSMMVEFDARARHYDIVA
jgi:heme-degrading monooxygenase HmoA